MDSPKWPEDIIEEENRNKLAKAEKEYQRQLSRLISFERDGTQWSGTGSRLNVLEENLDESFRRQLSEGIELNAGGHGTVRKVEYRKVTLAVKELKMRWLSAHQIEQLKQEGPIGQRLDSHKHVIKHVGTYYQGLNTVDPRLYILTFPVAICDLSQLLDDCEEISMPLRNRLDDFIHTGERLVSLGFHVSKQTGELKMEIKTRLHEIMGCLAKAVKWMHSNGVRHRDLKPANILLRPGQVLLTDFGISRHRLGTENTATETDVGWTWGYAAPEVLRNDGIDSLAKADVYSIGCVFLHILTVIHGPNVDLGQLPANFRESRGRHYLREQLFRLYFDTVPANDGTAHRPSHQFIPPTFTTFLASLLQKDSKARPSMGSVNRKLRRICGEDQWLYGPCCRKKVQTTATERNAEATPALTVSLPASQIGSNKGETRSKGADSKAETERVDAPTDRSCTAVVKQSGSKNPEVDDATSIVERLGRSVLSESNKMVSGGGERRTETTKKKSVKSDIKDFAYSGADARADVANTADTSKRSKKEESGKEAAMPSSSLVTSSPPVADRRPSTTTDAGPTRVPSLKTTVSKSTMGHNTETPAQKELVRAAGKKPREKAAEVSSPPEQHQSSGPKPRINVERVGGVLKDDLKLEKLCAQSDVSPSRASAKSSAQNRTRHSSVHLAPPDPPVAATQGRKSMTALRSEAQDREFSKRNSNSFKSPAEIKRDDTKITGSLGTSDTPVKTSQKRITPKLANSSGRGDARSMIAELGDYEERLREEGGSGKTPQVPKRSPLLEVKSAEDLPRNRANSPAPSPASPARGPYYVSSSDDSSVDLSPSFFKKIGVKWKRSADARRERIKEHGILGLFGKGKDAGETTDHTSTSLADDDDNE